MESTTQSINLFSDDFVGQSWIIKEYVYTLTGKGYDL